jgi:SPP1 gp7 family putative phage head morphogenesis protein
MLALLNQSEARLVQTMHELDPDLVSTRFKRQRIERMLADIRDQQNQLRKDFKSTLKGETDPIAANERKFTKKQLTEAAGAAFTRGFDFVSQARVQAAATSRPFQSVHLKWATQGEHVDELFRRRMGLVRDEIRRGFVEGATTPEIVNRIRGTRRLNFSDGILEISRRSAETMVRTAVNHTANAARQVIFEENEDLIAGVRYVAILDGRTTAICRALDGNIYPIDKGPRPPQHPNCRSTTVEILKDEIDSVAKGPRGTLNVKGGPEYNSYNDWLKTQPKPFVEDVLGKKKAKLYLDGNLPLDKFVDKKGAELTLDQLRVKESDAFKAAGLTKEQ